MIKNISFKVVALSLLTCVVGAKGEEKDEGGGKRPSGDFGINRRVHSVKAALKSRYNSETIRINLHTVTRPVGSAVVIPGR